MRADAVGVVQVSTSGSPGRAARSARTSGKAAPTSPIDAACTTTPPRAESGRATSPRRSAQRSRKAGTRRPSHHSTGQAAARATCIAAE
jgi:hypothetical protein